MQGFKCNLEMFGRAWTLSTKYFLGLGRKTARTRSWEMNTVTSPTTPARLGGDLEISH